MADKVNNKMEAYKQDKLEEQELSLIHIFNLSYETPENDATQKSVNPMAVSESGSMKIGQQHVSILSLTIICTIRSI